MTSPRFTIAKLSIWLCFAMHFSCSNSSSTAAETTSDAALSSQSGQTRPSPPVLSIPLLSVPLNCGPTRLPFKAGGLRFQMDQNTNPNFDYFKPIGDGKFGPEGHLYLTFPKKHAIVRFTQPTYDLEFFGEEQEGGRNEPIANPTTLAFWDQKIWVTNTVKGQVMVFNQGFELETLHQIQIQDPIPGPNQNFLIRSDQKPDTFFRADAKNKIRAQYMVPNNAELPKPMQILIFDIQEDWDIVAVNRGGTDLFHLGPKGHIKRTFQFEYPDSLNWQEIEVTDCQFIGDAYWLLTQAVQKGEPLAFLSEITIDGICRSLWQLPFLADGFDVDHDHLVLFQKILGKAQVYSR